MIQNSENITNKLIALATEDAINQIVEQLNIHSNRLACLLLFRKPNLVFVADVEGNQVILNKGKGYCKDMRLSIERKPKPVIDPVTGRVIRIKTKKIGEIKLTEVDFQSSLGEIISRNNKLSQFQVGDLAKPINPELCSKKSPENKSKPSNNK